MLIRLLRYHIVECFNPQSLPLGLYLPFLVEAIFSRYPFPYFWHWYSERKVVHVVELLEPGERIGESASINFLYELFWLCEKDHVFFSCRVLHLVNFLRIRGPGRLLERGDFYLVVVSYYFDFRRVPLALLFFQPLFFQFLCLHFRHGFLLETVCFSELNFVFFEEFSQFLCLLRLLYLRELVCLLLASPLVCLTLSLEFLSALGLCDVFHALFFE